MREEAGAGLKVVLHSPFREIAGGRELALAVPDPPLARQLLASLGLLYPGLARHFCSGDGDGEQVILVINGRLAGSHDQLNAGDEVHVCPQAWGG